jgi:Flp pilus assembly protein TadG
MSVRLRQFVRREDGSAILETALSMIILLTFMFGIMAVALALYSYHFISEAAREGTRYAIVRGSSAGSPCTAPGPPTCAAQSADVQAYVKGLNFPGINPGNMSVAPVWTVFPAGGICAPSASCNNPGNLVTVTVTYNFPLTIPFVPAHTYTMSSSSAMVISN